MPLDMPGPTRLAGDHGQGRELDTVCAPHGHAHGATLAQQWTHLSDHCIIQANISLATGQPTA
eukprot:12923607-Prorocentrum_lima.AAC.1